MSRRTALSMNASISLATLGVVYGDIGTSPLYAMRESLGGLPIDLVDVLGVLSLIFWSLIFIISCKYLLVLFRADNAGEGGILALLALIKQHNKKTPLIFLLIGVFGAGLMIGDGMLTPAISVMSAIEGLPIVMPSLSPWVMSLTIVILLLLFAVQSLGTGKIGFIFAPVILTWFLTIAWLGFLQILHNPVVLKAINPLYMIDFFYQNGWRGYFLLGGVFLVVTGGEALYADLGHFGKKPIRLTWFFLVMPSLLLSYFGQGAYLLTHPEAISNPFYLIAPKSFSVWLLILATFATIIASQAVISATFSLIKQAVLLGLYPHLPMVQTSDEKRGQIYIPQVNLMLALGTILLILNFKTSNALTHAYGIAVNLVMLMTSALVVYLAVKKWQWNPLSLLVLFLFFGVLDLAFLGANSQKLITGGWVPVLFALSCAFVMYTWYQGRMYLQKTYYMKEKELSHVLRQFDYKSLYHLPETTAIFITDIYDKSGGSFLNFLKLNRTIPENVLILNYVVEPVPRIKTNERFELKYLKEQICELTLRYGFMDTISVPKALSIAEEKQLLPFPIRVHSAIYFVEIPNVVASRKRRSLKFYWQEKLFAFLVRNYSTNLNIEFYHLPYDRTIAIGTYHII